MAKHKNGNKSGFSMNPDMTRITNSAGNPSVMAATVNTDKLKPGQKKMVEAIAREQGAMSMRHNSYMAMDKSRDEKGVLSMQAMKMSAMGLLTDPDKKNNNQDPVSGNTSNFQGNITLSPEGTNISTNLNTNTPSSSSSSSSSKKSSNISFKESWNRMSDEQKSKFKNFEDYETQAKAYNLQKKNNQNNNISTSSSSQSSSPSVRDLTNKKLSLQNKKLFDIVSGNLQTEIEAISDSIADSDYSKTISALSTNKKQNILNQLRPLVESGYLTLPEYGIASGRKNYSLEDIIFGGGRKNTGGPNFYAKLNGNLTTLSDSEVISRLVGSYAAYNKRKENPNFDLSKQTEGYEFNLSGQLVPKNSRFRADKNNSFNITGGSSNRTKDTTGFSYDDIVEGSVGDDSELNRFFEAVKKNKQGQ